MINTQTQIDSLIDLAVLQRTELKQLVDSLPQLRDHLSSEIERNLEEIEPAIRSELEQFVAARALDTQAKTSAELSAKLDAMARNLESTTAAKYSVLMAERAQNATLLAQAEARIAEAASALPGAVKGIVTNELSRFPRAGEIDQLRKEFAEPRGLNPRGRWQVGETYNKLDLVSYNGDSYVSNTDGNREKPSRSSEAWTLSAARGNGGAGGGVTSLTDLVAVPANGELLIGNGSAFVNNTLTAGTGVTITNGPGTITIDASGAQEILTATVTNAESFAITRGQVVYLFGATGNRASVKLADNTSDAASSKTFGVVSEASIAAGANGLITCVGTVDKLALGSYTEGDVLYLGATPGAVTNVKPYAPNHLVYVGMVERANNGNGELYVRIQNGFELDEIHDVQITTPPLAGALLMRDATNSLWKANRLTGTANQVTVTNADTSVTLSLPTAIANVNSVTAATTQNLTLAGGSTGASLVLLQGANGAINITSNGSGSVNVNPGSTGSVNINGASGVGKLAVRTGTNENAHFRTATAIGGTGVGLDMLNDASGATVGFTLRSSATRLTGGNVTVPDGNLLIGSTTDSSSRLKLVGTDNSGPKTWTASSAALSGGLLDSYQDSGGNGFQRYTDIVSLQDSDGANGGGVIRFVTNSISSDSGTEAMRVTKLQNLLIGTTTDMSGVVGGLKIAATNASSGAGSGALQVAGGIYSGANSVFGGTINAGSVINASGINSLVKSTDGTVVTKIQSLSVGDPNVGYVGTESNHPLRIIVGNTSRLTIDTAGAATFAGAVTTGGNLTLPAAPAAANRYILTGTSNTGTGQLVIQAGGGSTGWGGNLNLFETAHATKGGWVGVGLGVSGAKFTVNSTGFSESGEVASIDRTGAATFAGAVTGSRFIASTSLIAGDFTSTNDLGIVAKTTTATYNPLIAAFLAPNQLTFGVGGYSNVYCGVAQSAYNSGALMFSYAGAGSTSNSFGLGIYGQSPAIRIDGTGVVNIPSTTASGGAGSGALQVAGGIYAGAASVFGGAVSVTRSVNTLAGSFIATNTSAGAGAGGVFSASNGTASGWFGISGTGYTTYGIQTANSVGVYTDQSIFIASDNPSGRVKIGVGSGIPAVGDFSSTGLAITGTLSSSSTVITPAATTAISSVRLPHGTAPTSPVNGDMWTTTAGLYVRINGVTVGPLS